jgi:ATP-dependent exoDNAse (exonuclease V) beta subunit
MLDQVTPDGIDATGEAMKRQLATLFASPDPTVGERCGIQLMTMHKAKGLGFNVVVLPGLHRITRSNPPTLIRYLERAAEVGTELLVVPIDDAGEETSPLNRWVRLQKENREAEERKRLLYVACTRAREELHLFATATVTNGRLSCKPSSLLGTAWPALKSYFEEQYKQAALVGHTAAILDFPSVSTQINSGVLNTVAAVGRPTALRHLPSDWRPLPLAPNVPWRGAKAIGVSAEDEEESKRPQGSRSSRILGTSIHALFERAARLFNQGASEADLRAALPAFRVRAVALARNAGLPPVEVESMARKAVEALEAALSDPHGLWILKPHRDAQIECSWTGLIDGIPLQRRMDRTFRAGPEPLTDGEDFLWVIDYKSSDRSAAGLEAFLADERVQYAKQLQGYARMMHLAHGESLQLRLALYYPLIGKLLVATSDQSDAGVDEASAWRTW